MCKLYSDFTSPGTNANEGMCKIYSDFTTPSNKAKDRAISNMAISKLQNAHPDEISSVILAQKAKYSLPP